MTRKTQKTAQCYRPFANLKNLLDKASVSLPEGPKDQRIAKARVKYAASREDDESIFRIAVADVEPIAREICPSDSSSRNHRWKTLADPDAEALSKLNNLVEGGRGFVVAQTAEYIEGTGYGVDPKVARRLHNGEFALQGHIDLHGLGAAEAKEAFNDFLREALVFGKRVVLIVHGRGRSSKDRPVLKRKVKKWLTTGLWRKWVIAFSSARACDGGAGATYVLLRKRPATKRYRKSAKGT